MAQIDDWKTELNRLEGAFNKGPTMKTRSDGSVMPYYEGVSGIPIEKQMSALKKNIAYQEQSITKDVAETARYNAQMAEHAKANSPEASALLKSNPSAYMQTYGSATDKANLPQTLATAVPKPETIDPTTLRANANGLGATSSPLGGATGMQPDLNAKYQQGFQSAQGAGVQSPSDGGTGRQIVQQFTPPTTQTNPMLDSFFQEDKNLGNFSKQVQEYLNPTTQQQTLKQEYEGLVKAKGIEAINTELLNMKNVIEGSEDDIRTEITKAGGFATDSQVMALTNARNKTLIKNYNNLLQTKQNSENYISTLMGFSQEDRQIAQQRMDSQLNLGFKLQEMQQQMKQNAQNTLNNVVSKVGYDGLQAMAKNDPYYTSLIENTLGLGAGGLAQLSIISAKERAAEEAKNQLDLDYKKAQMAELGKKDLQFVSGTDNQRSGYFDKTTGKFTPTGGGGGGTGTNNKLNELLSVDEATKLGVPYGTTKGQAVGQQSNKGSAGGNFQNLLQDYSKFLGDYSAFKVATDPTLKATKNSLVSQLTAEYKQMKQLGTLDAGVQKLIDGLLGQGGLASISNSAQKKVVDDLITKSDKLAPVSGTSFKSAGGKSYSLPN